MLEESELFATQSDGTASQPLTLSESDTQYDTPTHSARTDISEAYLSAVDYIEMASNECLKTDSININNILSSAMSCANSLVALISHEENPTRRQALQQISVILESHIAVLLKQRGRMQGHDSELSPLNTKNCASVDKYASAIEATVAPFDSSLTFKQITGYAKAKSLLKESLIFPKLFQGIFPFKNQNILLYGPPGTGKTQLALALANEFNAKCYSISSADILSSWVGESEKFIKSLLRIASSQEDHSLILFDEIDSLCRQRQSHEEEYTRRIKTELMQQMEKGARADCKLSIIGITNCPWDIDRAFLRRFNKRIYIQPPDSETKLQLLIDSLAAVDHGLTYSQFENLSSKLDLFSCSDICALCCEAMLGPLRELQSSEDWEWSDKDAKWRPVPAPTSVSVKKSLFDINCKEVCPRKLALSDVVNAMEEIHGTVCNQDIRRFEEFTKQFGVSA